MVGSSIGWLLRALRFETEQKSRIVTITPDFDTTDDFSNYIASLLFFLLVPNRKKRGLGQVGRSEKARPVQYGENHQALPI